MKITDVGEGNLVGFCVVFLIVWGVWSASLVMMYDAGKAKHDCTQEIKEQ